MSTAGRSSISWSHTRADASHRASTCSLSLSDTPRLSSPRSGRARSPRSFSPSCWSPSALAPISGQSALRVGRGCSRCGLLPAWGSCSPAVQQLAWWCQMGVRMSRRSSHSRRHSAPSEVGCSRGSSHPPGRGRLSPTLSSSSARADRGRCVTSSLVRSAIRPSRSATCFRTRVRSSTPRATLLPFPTRGPTAQSPSSRAKGRRSLLSSMIQLCSTIRVSARRSRRQPGSRPRTRDSRQRCASR